jgi:hypothetical protein
VNVNRVILGVVLIVAGALFAVEATGWWDAGEVAGLIWPLLLLGLGVTLLVRRPPVPPVAAEEVLHLTAVFSGRRAVWAANPFRGASMVALFGGVDLDLRPAVIGPEGAFVDATAAFGGIKVIVPTGWKVVMSGPAIFGGNENNTDAFGAFPVDAPSLTVRALSLFGGVEVQSQPDPREPVTAHVAGAGARQP